LKRYVDALAERVGVVINTKMITSPLLLCRMESEQSAERVLDAVSRSLSNYPFDFQGARIITGQEEGAYGWITINYLLGKFTQVNTS
jgi:apyrase